MLTIAHRGARHVAPENTLIALEKAASRGADFVEVDVQRSKDGRLVLMHDVSLRRTTNVEKVFPKRRSYDVVDFKWRDIKKLDAGRWKADKYVGERIPTLKQALRLVQARDLGILIEMKSPHRYPDVEADVADALREVVDFIGPAIGEDQLRVQSFDFGAAQRFKAIEPQGAGGSPRHADARPAPRPLPLGRRDQLTPQDRRRRLRRRCAFVRHASRRSGPWTTSTT